MIVDVHAHYLPKKFSDFMGDRFWPRIGVPDDIAWLAVYLASDESEFITGQVIGPNGGAFIA